MKPKKWSLFENYTVNHNGVVTNNITGRTLRRTVKGYTIGYYIAGKFYSLKALRPHLRIFQEVICPF